MSTGASPFPSFTGFGASANAKPGGAPTGGSLFVSGSSATQGFGAGTFGSKPASGFSFGSSGTSGTASGGSGSGSSLSLGGSSSSGTGLFGSKSDASGPPSGILTFEQLKDKSVKEVLDYFDERLKEQVSVFNDMKQHVIRNDRRIYSCLALMKHLDGQIISLNGAKGKLIKRAKHLTELQYPPYLEGKQPQQAQNEDKSKPEGKTEAESEVVRNLKALRDTRSKFARIIEGRNGTAAAPSRSSTEREMMQKIRDIANNQLSSLQWIGRTVADLEERIEKLKDGLDLTEQ